MRKEQPIVAHHYSAAFLPSVLERIQTVVGCVRHISAIFGINSKHSAFLMDTAHIITIPFREYQIPVSPVKLPNSKNL